MTRFRLYVLLLGFAMCVLLIQTAIPYSWHWKANTDSFAHNYQNTQNQILNQQKQGLNNKKLLVSNDIRDQINKRKSMKKLPFLEHEDWYPPWSYDRFMANMTHIFKQKRNQQELKTLLSTAFNPLNSLPIIAERSVTRILLFTYFRSGSTFLGDLLQQNWKSFYTFEPLHYMSDGVRIEDDRLEEATHIIDHIFRCNFPRITNYVEWVHKTRNQFLLKWNKFLWGICRFRVNTCFDPNFISQTCKRAKVQVMKVARLHMRHLETLLPKLDDLNVNVIYLVRDPRGTLKSRQNMMWCSHKTNCSDVNSLCSEMRNDLNAFKRLQQINPSKFTLIRYEDLSTDPTKYAKLLLQKLAIPYSSSVKRFLRTHTNSSSSDLSKRNPYTTIRNSKTVAYEWMQTLNMTYILQVQKVCPDLLREFNYKFITNDSQSLNQTIFSDKQNKKL